jgi:hypothetical protein
LLHVLNAEAELSLALDVRVLSWAFFFANLSLSSFQTYRKALSGHVNIPDHFNVVVTNLIKKLLHTDQSKRLGRTVGGTTAVMCHRWYANFDWVSFVTRMPVIE